ncbi:RimK family alpha-L-glutamate ligase [Natronomonas halophila]|uniref:RimK family alpha-L-glutamate ligase n=1 Tax=Natronomonas halophila TaxID=2747817 RepID=UPI0015B395FC|nr:RimK family alpha-L-glutamate ligase [Natronomonas halophila]QLD87225.1 RimK family alpha-L-glutamate ligase [Natronomonas halophila]
MSSDITVGVLSLHSSKESKAILNAADALGYDTEWLRAENTSIGIEDGEVTLEPDVDIVVNRLLLSKEEQPAEALGLATMLDRMVPMLNTPTTTMTAIHKFASGTALAEAGVPVPDAFMALSADTLNANRDRFADEVVYKTAIGTHGGGTWKLDTDDQINPMVGSRQAFLQELIEHDEKRHHDLRIYVVGEQVVGAMNRYAAEGEWRTNVALGGEVEDATENLPEEVITMAKRAADVIGLDYAGVDIVQGEDGYYVLEVNPTAGFRGLYKATGRSPAPHIAALAIERAGGDVERERVRELTANLDDSRPACMPKKQKVQAGEPLIIGYIEEVVVMGTTGQKSVLAKSDTGATRTSIDARLAADIGTGPIKDIVKIKSGSVKKGKSRPVVDVVVGIGGRQHTVTASVEDRSHMEYPLLLGRDILGDYHVDVRKQADEDEPAAIGADATLEE